MVEHSLRFHRIFRYYRLSLFHPASGLHFTLQTQAFPEFSSESVRTLTFELATSLEVMLLCLLYLQNLKMKCSLMTQIMDNLEHKIGTPCV